MPRLPRKESEVEEFLRESPESVFWGMWPGAWYRAVRDRDEVAAFYIGVGLGATGGAMLGTAMGAGAFAATDNFVTYAFMQKVRYMPVAMMGLFAWDFMYVGIHDPKQSKSIAIVGEAVNMTGSLVYPPKKDTRGGNPIFDFSSIWS